MSHTAAIPLGQVTYASLIWGVVDWSLFDFTSSSAPVTCRVTRSLSWSWRVGTKGQIPFRSR